MYTRLISYHCQLYMWMHGLVVSHLTYTPSQNYSGQYTKSKVTEISTFKIPTTSFFYSGSCYITHIHISKKKVVVMQQSLKIIQIVEYSRERKKKKKNRARVHSIYSSDCKESYSVHVVEVSRWNITLTFLLSFIDLFLRFALVSVRWVASLPAC